MKPASKPLPGFSKKEVTGVIALFIIILLLYIGAHFIRYAVQQPVTLNARDSAWLLAASRLQEQALTDSQTSYTSGQLFNQATTQSYFSPPAERFFILIPMNYRPKGGKNWD